MDDSVVRHSWSRTTNSVTMPKLAPFPRMPQKSSGSLAPSTRTTFPAVVTIS